MKKLILFACLVCGSAFATDLSIVNKTGGDMRVASLMNSCGDFIVNEDKPVHLKDGESFDLKGIVPVMHHYKICGAGYCSSTAMGIKDDIHYVLEVVLEDGFLINGVPMPDHWVGNTECPKKD